MADIRWCQDPGTWLNGKKQLLGTTAIHSSYSYDIYTYICYICVYIYISILVTVLIYISILRVIIYIYIHTYTPFHEQNISYQYKEHISPNVDTWTEYQIKHSFCSLVISLTLENNSSVKRLPKSWQLKTNSNHDSWTLEAKQSCEYKI